jgi:hypothetical protein
MLNKKLRRGMSVRFFRVMMSPRADHEEGGLSTYVPA